MEAKIREFFASMLQVSADDVTSESTPDSLARWDSMQHLILIGSVEEEFDVVIDPDEIVDMYENYRCFEQAVLAKLASN